MKEIINALIILNESTLLVGQISALIHGLRNREITEEDIENLLQSNLDLIQQERDRVNGNKP